MNKIWFFGCSLTYGSGIHHVDGTFDDRWSKLVCNHFDRDECNKGEPGASNEMILMNVRKFYDDIQPSDWVVLQSTFAGRSFGFHKETDLPIRFNLMDPNASKSLILKWIGGKSDGKKYSVFDHNLGERVYIDHTVSSEKLLYDLSEYSANVRFPYLPKWKKYFDNEFDFYINRLIEKGCKVIYWDYNDRFQFETIEEFTHGEIKDYHYSLKGHKDFSEKIIKELVAY